MFAGYLARACHSMTIRPIGPSWRGRVLFNRVGLTRPTRFYCSCAAVLKGSRCFAKAKRRFCGAISCSDWLIQSGSLIFDVRQPILRKWSPLRGPHFPDRFPVIRGNNPFLLQLRCSISKSCRAAKSLTKPHRIVALPSQSTDSLGEFWINI